VNVPIKGIVTNKGSISGTGVRNSDSRTIEDQDWEGAPRLKVFAPGHGGEAESKLRQHEILQRGNQPIRADHSQVIGMTSESRTLTGAGQSAGQRVFNYNEDETRLN